jgi:hypothetical protein
MYVCMSYCFVSSSAGCSHENVIHAYTYSAYTHAGASSALGTRRIHIYIHTVHIHMVEPAALLARDTYIHTYCECADGGVTSAVGTYSQEAEISRLRYICMCEGMCICGRHNMYAGT